MAVSSVTEIVKDRSGKRQEKGVREYARTFHVEVSDQLDSPAIVMADSRVPRIGSIYASGNDFDFNARCYDVGCQRTERLTRYEVTARYKSQASSESEEDDDDPLKKPVVWSGGYKRKQRILEVDANGARMVNAANQKFDPVPDREERIPVIVAKRNEAKIPLAFWDRRGCINSDTVKWIGYTFKPKELLCDEIRWQQAFWGIKTYYECEYTFEWDPGEVTCSTVIENGTLGSVTKIGHDILIANMGRMQLVSGELKACVDKFKQPVADPVGLTVAGEQLGASSDVLYYRRQPNISATFSVFHF